MKKSRHSEHEIIKAVSRISADIICRELLLSGKTVKSQKRGPEHLCNSLLNFFFKSKPP